MKLQRTVLILVVLSVLSVLVVTAPNDLQPRKRFGFRSRFNRRKSLGIWAPDIDNRFWHGYDIDGYTRNG